MSEVFTIVRNGFEVQVNKLVFEAYGKLKSEDECQLFFDSLRSPKKPTVAAVEPQVQSTVEATLAQRGSRYGDFTDHARICQNLKEVMSASMTENGLRNPWSELDDVKKQALEVIADKIARILSGDPNYDDNWHDIQGYAKLVEERLPK